MEFFSFFLCLVFNSTEEGNELKTIQVLRADFENESNRAVSMPIAGTVVWYSFPETRIFAVASVIVAVYLVSIYQMLNRDLTN